jgi:hypothetical protein
VRLLHGGPARWHPGLCPDRDRARQQAHQDSRSHFACHRGMDRSAGPQPDHGPRRAGEPGQVHDPGPRFELHRCVRRGPRRCRDPDRALQRPDAAHECDRRTLDRRMPARLLDRTLVWNQAHLRRILHEYEIHHNQHRPHRSLAAAAPLKPLPEPVDLDRYHVRRQADQRVPPGRMTWTRFSARTPFWSRSKMNGKSASAATCPKDPWPSSSSHPQARRG